MTGDEAVEWFWRTCPAGCRIEVIVVRSVHTDGFVYVDDDYVVRLDGFLDRCAVVAGEPWQGSLDHDSELVEFVRSAVLSAYGRTDACRVTVQR